MTTGSPRVFWTGVGVGGAVIAFGVFGLVANAGEGVADVRLVPWLAWALGALVLHDLVVVPLTLLVGRGLRRVRPALLRTPLQAGLALTAIFSLAAYPYLRGYGRAAQPGNASLQPGDYWSALLTILAVVWLAAAGLTAWRARRR
ncbi:MAG: hypothetical protein ACRD0K_15155 [Egibacteraceae bacterium]